MPPTVALIAQGAMGAGLAGILTKRGVTVLTSLAGRGEASAHRARVAGMRAVADPELAAADLVLSVVPPAEARALAERLAPHLGAHAVYADCNAVSPATVAGIAAVIAPTGRAFADVGIIGLPPTASRDPVLYASGPGAAALGVLRDYGLDVRDIGGPVGAASALKMSYAGITKGLTGLATTMLLAASRAGAAPALIAELAASRPDLLRFLTRSIPDMQPKAYRWGPEMTQIADFTDGLPGAPGIYAGLADLYAALAADVAGPGEHVAALEAALALVPRA